MTFKTNTLETESDADLLFIGNQHIKEKQYWLDQLSGTFVKSYFPFRFRKYSDKKYKHAVFKYQIPYSTSKNILKLSKNSYPTTHVILTSAVIGLLYKYNKEVEGAIGVPIYKQEEDKNLINSSLILRYQVEKRMSFRDLLVQVKDTLIKAVEHQNYPLQLIPKLLNPNGEKNNSSMFETAVLLTNIHTIEYLSDLKLPLVFSFSHTEGTLEGGIDYNQELYNEEDIHQISKHLLQFLAEALPEHMKSVDEIALLSKTEKNQILEGFNDVKKPFKKNKLLHHLFEEQVLETPNNIAVSIETDFHLSTAEKHSLTYTELNEKSNQLARFLRKKGVKANSFVGICLEPSLDMIVSLMAVWKSGGAYVPLDPKIPEKRLNMMIDDSEINILLSKQEYKKNINKDNLETTLIDDDWDLISQENQSNLETLNVSTDLAYMMYTSGSTGKPKGVMVPHIGVINLAEDYIARFSVTESDNVMQFAGFSFDVSVSEFVMALFTGASLIIAPPMVIRDYRLFEKYFNKQKITIATFTPPYLTQLIVDNINPLRYIITIGSETNPNLVKKWSKKAIYVNTYGPTECSIAVTAFQVDNPNSLPFRVPIGKPLQNVKAYILDKNNIIQPIGITGELCFTGDCVVLGYWKREDKTEEVFVDNPFETGTKMYRTGDLGRWLPDGNIEFLGRIDNQVKIRGFRIEPGETEHVLLQHKDVLEAVVTARKDKNNNGYLASYYTLKPGKNKESREIRQYLAKELPSYMIPDFFIELKEFPTTASDKIDRQGLPDPEDIIQDQDEPHLPSNPLEEKVITIWQECFDIKSLHVSDNFFDLGGNSLKAIAIVSKTNELFQVDLTVPQLFSELQTVKDIARWISSVASENKEIVTERSDVEEFVSLNVVNDKENHFNPFPLTPIQTSYLLGRDELFEMGGVGTHVYLEIELYDQPEVIINSFKKIIKRQDALRIVFDAKTYSQRILSEVPDHPFSFEDLSKSSPEDQNKRIVEERDRMTTHVFEPETWPLFELKVFKLADKVSYICFGIDMLIIDATSFTILMQDFLKTFNNPKIALPDLEFSFKDYVMATKQIESLPIYEKSKEFWSSKLQGFPEAPKIPLSINPNSVQDSKYQRKEILFNEQDWIRLKEKARKHRITPSNLLTTLYAQVLAFWSNQEDIAVSFTVPDRHTFNTHFDEVIGDFTAIVLVGLTMKSDKSLWENAIAAQQSLAEALEHRFYNGLEFLRDLNKAKGHNAIMPYTITSTIGYDEDNVVDFDSLGKIKMIMSRTSQVYLDCQLSEIDKELYIAWDYVESIYAPEVIDGMFANFVSCLNQLLERDVEILELKEPKTEYLVKEYNSTKQEIKPIHLSEFLVQQAKQTPDLPAIISSDEMVDFRDLDIRSNQVAHYLMEKGVSTNDFVAVLGERNPTAIINIFGILKAGGVYIPIDPEYPEDRQKYIFEHSQCRLFLNGNSWTENDIQNYSKEEIKIDRSIDDLAYVIYTSGSSGKPKGVMITHRAVSNTIIDMNQRFSVKSEDRIMGISSLCFDLSVYDIFGAVSTGAALVLISSQKEIKEMIETLDERKISLWNSVPAIAEIATQYLDDDYRNPHLKTVLLSGDWIPLSLPAKIKHHFPNAQVISLGGATEVSIWSIYYPVLEVKSNWKSIPYGMPLANQQLFVLNKTKNICPIGVPGEIYIGGVGLALGYLNDIEKTNNAFISHHEYGNLYHTGDYGIFRKEGYIEFLGRMDQQVKIRGYRIELGEIETILRIESSVKDAVVAIKTSASNEKQLVAYLVLNTNPNNAPISMDIEEKHRFYEDIKSALKESLPEYMIPSLYMIIDKIPLSPNGKVDRKSLPIPKLENVKSQEGITAPKSELEKLLVNIWESILGIEALGVTQNFFDLGGNSVHGMQIALEAQKKGIDMRPTHPFYYQTVRELAVAVQKDSKKTVVTNIEMMERSFKEHFNEEMSMVMHRITDYENTFEKVTKDYNIAYVADTILKTDNKELLMFFVNKIDESLHPHYILPISQKPENYDKQRVGITTAQFLNGLGIDRAVTIKYIEKELQNSILQFNHSILSHPIIKTYIPGAVQLGHMSLKNRHLNHLIYFDNPIDREVLNKAFSRLIKEQPLLRSFLFKEKEGIVWKEIEFPEEHQLSLPFIDLSNKKIESRDTKLRKFLKKQMMKIRPLENTLLYEAILFQKNYKEYILSITFDHIICDAISMKIVEEKILKYYDLYLEDKEVQNKEIERYSEYLDFINEGPQRINEKEVIDIYKLEEYSLYKNKFKNVVSNRNKGKAHKIHCIVPMDKSLGEDKVWEYSFIMYATMLKNYFDIPKIPLKIISYGRQYEERSFFEAIGEFIDFIPVLATIDKDNSSEVAAHARKCLEVASQHRINFNTLMGNSNITENWQNTKDLLDADNTNDRLFTFNFQGSLDREGLKRWMYIYDDYVPKDVASIGCDVIYESETSAIHFIIYSDIENDLEQFDIKLKTLARQIIKN